jgi:hypothetical protein
MDRNWDPRLLRSTLHALSFVSCNLRISVMYCVRNTDNAMRTE